MRKRQIERLANIAPTSKELERGADLAEKIEGLKRNLVGFRLDLTASQNEHVLLIPTNPLERTRFHIEGTHRISQPIRKSTAPFLLRTIEYAATWDNLDDDETTIAAESMYWKEPTPAGHFQFFRDTYNYYPAINLAQHALAVVSKTRDRVVETV